MEKRILQLKQHLRAGVVPAMATPLQADGRQVNRDVVPVLVDFLINRGVAGLFVGGTTGEGLLLAPAQRQQLHEAVMTATAGRVPILLHVGHNSRETAIDLVRQAAELGAAAIVAITPTFYALPDEALLDHFNRLAAAAPEMPLFVYDIPHMAINGVGPSLLRRLSQSLPGLAGIKSSRPDAQVVRQLIDAAPEQLTVMAGNERIALGLLAMGADGLISGLSTAVPEPFIALVDAFFAADMAAAQQAQRCINRLLDLVPAGSRIGAIKAILAERGVPVGPAVAPQTMPAGPLWPDLAALLQQHGYLND